MFRLSSIGVPNFRTFPQTDLWAATDSRAEKGGGGEDDD